MNVKEKLKELIPTYAILPITLVAAFNFSAYYISKIIIEDREKYDLSLPLDDMIPLLTPFIFIYVLAFAQWAFGYLVLVKQSRRCCSKVAASNLIAKTLCFIIFITLPTEMARPEVTGGGLSALLTRFIYAADTPVNLFPSIHCLESYCIMRFTLGEKQLPKWYKILMTVFTFLVFASVLFTRQHIIVDIPAGILMLEIGILVSRITGFDKVFMGKGKANNELR